MGPRTLVFPGNDAADELARRGALLVISVIPCSLFLFSFSDWRRTVSSKFFDTQVPSISTQELVLPLNARCVLSRLPCNGHILLLRFYLTKIGRILPAAPAYTSHLILHCPATDSLRHSIFDDYLSLYDLWGSMVFCHAPIPGKRLSIELSLTKPSKILNK